MSKNVCDEIETLEIPDIASQPFRELRHQCWHESAPELVRRAYLTGEDEKGWAAWAKHLIKRKRPKPIDALLPKRDILLGLTPLPNGLGGATTDLLVRLHRLGSRKKRAFAQAEEILLAWLADASGSNPTSEYALETVAFSHTLPFLASVLPSEPWWDLMEHLLDTVHEAGNLSTSDDPLIHQLLAGELPLTLAYLFPEIGVCHHLVHDARQVLSIGLVDLLDGEGLPHGRHLDVFRELAACWVRCESIGAQFEEAVFDKKAHVQYEWLAFNVLALSRYDHQPIFSNTSKRLANRAFLKSMVDLAGDTQDRDLAALLWKKTKRPGTRLPKPAFHSEWAGVAMLRSKWSRKSPRMTAVYHDESVRLELETARGVLFSGVWELDVRRDGHPLSQPTPWSETCWVSDQDVDYLELEAHLDEGLRVQRHLILARKDRFLFLADALLGENRSQLEYRGTLPLADGVAWEEAEETREGWLRTCNRAATVLPLALPEWRAENHAGSLKSTDAGLELQLSVEGTGLFAPLFVDLKPRRMHSPLTWRQLTVAESLSVQPNDVAVGYRVRIDRKQWLIYRALHSIGNRTLLGHNLSSEMLLGRFGFDGEVKTLLEIE